MRLRSDLKLGLMFCRFDTRTGFNGGKKVFQFFTSNSTGIVSFSTCVEIVSVPFLHNLALTNGLVFSCNPSQALSQCIFSLPTLLWQCNFLPMCPSNVVHVLCLHTSPQSRPLPVWTAQVAICVFKALAPICFDDILSCWVSFPEVRWQVVPIAVNHTFHGWPRCVQIHLALLFPSICTPKLFLPECPWYLFVYILVAWVVSWDRNLKCPWS